MAPPHKRYHVICPGMSTNETETARLQAFRAALPQQLRFIVIYCLAAWLAFTLYGTVQRLMALYVPIPMGDYWRVPESLKAYQTLQLGVFWKQHNEHRIVFPEIFFALDMLFARDG